MKNRRVVVLRNPRSGRGKAERIAGRISSRLVSDGWDVAALDIRAAGIAGDLASVLGDEVPMLIVGGDGTVHHALEAAVKHRSPIYHVPTGNENLFAREFGMDRRWETVRRALEVTTEHRRVVDVGSCNGRLFSIMCSIGFDAEVVRRVAEARRGGVWHGDYLRRGLEEFIRPTWNMLSIDVDGRELVHEQAGMVVVANSAQYAARLNPAREARVDDAALDVVFLPMKSRVQLLGCGMRLAYTRSKIARGCIWARGSEIRIRSMKKAAAYQLDGEYAGMLDGTGRGELRLQVLAGVLRVLAWHDQLNDGGRS